MTKSNRSGSQSPTRDGPGDHQRQRDHAGDHREDVEQERQRPGLDDPAVPAEPVHDRDGVDEDVERARARPQRQHEAERDDVEAAALAGRRRSSGTMIRSTALCGQRPLGEVDDRGAHVGHLGGGELVGDVADRPGEREDQRRHREHREERRLGGQARSPGSAGRSSTGRDDQPPDHLAGRSAPGRQRRSERRGRGWVSEAGHGPTVATCRRIPGRHPGRHQPGLRPWSVTTWSPPTCALVEAVTRHGSAEVVEDLTRARRRGRHRRGPRARDAGQREPPAADAVRPLRQPDRRGRLPPVLALADGARGRARPRRRALGVGRPRTPTCAAPPASWPGRTPSRGTAARSR